MSLSRQKNWRDHRIPLVFLEAYQTAKAEKASESVASELLKVGVASEVALSHSVLAETTSPFVEAFYDGLASGARVGDAMLKGRRQLEDDNFSGHVFGEGDLRIFEDEAGKMNRSLLDVKASALVVSQFTLYGDVRRQRRPSFVAAAPPEQAKIVYEGFAEALRRLGVTVATGDFGAMMSVELVNEGPVTILLDSDKTF